MNNSSIDQVFFIDLFLFFLNKRMQVGITWQGPLKWPLIINDLNSLCLSSTKATIVHCILELGSTIYLDSFGIFGGRVIIYVEVDYGNLVFFLCKFWKPLPRYYLVFFFFLASLIQYPRTVGKIPDPLFHHHPNLHPDD